MLRFLLYFLLGTVQISIQSASPERVLNRLESEGISFWRPYCEETQCMFRCTNATSRDVYRILSEMGIGKLYQRRFGLPVLLSTKARKIWFWLFLFLSVVIPLISGRFVMEITVSGNNTVDTTQILTTLDTVGVRKYAYIPNLELKAARQHLLLCQSDLSWATLNLVGNTIEVIVHEKSKQQTILPDQPCNIVAAYDGLVLDTNVLSGKQLVKKHTAVRKGQLLVSGFSDTETGKLSYLHAQAVIMAEVEMQKSYTVDLSAKDYRETEERTELIELWVLGFRFPLYWSSELPRQPYTVETTASDWRLFQIKLPFGWQKKSYTLYDEISSGLTQTDAKAILEKRFAEYERYELEDAVLIEKGYELQVSGQKITMTGHYRLQMDIARKVAIEVKA